MSFLSKWKSWIDNEAPPWANLIITAGFHTLFTIAAGQLGLSAHAAFGYAMKEGGPFFGSALTGKLKEAYTPSPAMARHGWTRRWVIADSVADVLGPCIAAMLYASGVLA